MSMLELQVEIDGTQRLTLRTSPETPLIEVASMLLTLTQLVLQMTPEQESPHDGDSATDRGFNDSLSGPRFQTGWDFPNLN